MVATVASVQRFAVKHQLKLLILLSVWISFLLNRNHRLLGKEGGIFKTTEKTTTRKDHQSSTQILPTPTILNHNNISSSSSSSHFLGRYIEARRGDRCNLKERFQPSDITYCAVARSGSTTLSTFFHHHEHPCTVQDLERIGARRIIIPLRHPLARICSGFSRRMEGLRNQKTANQVLYDNFGGKGGVGNYISAIRDVSHPHHDAAITATFGRNKQNYFMPVTEFYLQHSYHQAEIYFLCMESIHDDLESAFIHWNQTLKSETFQSRNPSKTSSGNWTYVLSQFSEDNIRWVENTYVNDIALYKRHCHDGYQAYLDSQSMRLQQSL